MTGTSVTAKVGRTEASSTAASYFCEYDENGNITAVRTGSANGCILCRYEYDDLSQLVCEDNAVTGKTYCYEYDNAGNIQRKKIYPFTTSALSGAYESDDFYYRDPTWGDLLTGIFGVRVGMIRLPMIRSETRPKSNPPMTISPSAAIPCSGRAAS